MNYRKFLALYATVLLLISCNSRKGCRDQSALNYDATADKDCNGCCAYKSNTTTNPPTAAEGSVMFWTNDPYLINSCQNVTVIVSDGSKVSITGSFSTMPNTCTSTNGGYISLPPGDYTYTVVTKSCTHQGGSFTITANNCILHQI